MNDGSGEGFIQKATSLSIPRNELTAGALVFDYNGDGRDDILNPKTGDVLVANSQYDFDVVGGVVDAMGGGEAIALDFDGDGAKDILLVEGPGEGIKLWRSLSGQTGLLRKVTDAFGKEIRVEYEAHSPSTRGSWRGTYINTHESSDSYTRLLQNVSSLVSTHTEAQTGGELHRYEYQYEDAREGLGGRGWFGFARRSVTEMDGEQPKRKIDLTFRNDRYWSAGLESRRVYTSGFSQRNGLPYSRQSEIRQGWNGYFGAWSTQIAILPESTEWIVSETLGDVSSELSYILTQRAFDPQWANVGASVTRFCRRSTCASNSSEVLKWREENISYGGFGYWLNFKPTRYRVEEEGPTREYGYDYYPGTTRLRFVTREPQLIGAPDSTLYRQTEFVRSPPLWNLESVAVRDATGGERETTIAYDSRGLFPTRVNQAIVGHESELEFSDRTGQLLTQRDANGFNTQVAYDAFGRPREVRSPTTVERSWYEIPGEDDCPSVSNSVMCTIKASFDAGSSSESLADATGGFEINVLNGFGRKVKAITAGFENARVQVDFEYSARGLLKSTTYPFSSASEGAESFQYDAFDRIKTVTTSDGLETRFEYLTRADADIPEDLFTYVTDMAAVVVTRPDLSRQATVSNIYGQPRRVLEAGNGSELTDGLVTNYYYGDFNQLELVSSPDDYTTYEYDRIGRVVEIESGATGRREIQYSGFDDVALTRDARARKAPTATHLIHWVA